MDHNYILPDVFENNVEEVGVSLNEDVEVIAVTEIYQIIPGVQNRTRIDVVDNLGLKYKRGIIPLYINITRGNRVYLIYRHK
jgi:hypothetical protein